MFGDRYSDPGSENEKSASDGTSVTATIKAGVKSEALKVLARIPQSVHVVIKQRLERLPPIHDLSSKQKAAIEQMLRYHRQVSECIDESAESIYMGDLEGCLKKAGEARQITISIVEAVYPPWYNVPHQAPKSQESKEDRYIHRALDWIRQVDTSPRTLKKPDFFPDP